MKLMLRLNYANIPLYKYIFHRWEEIVVRY